METTCNDESFISVIHESEVPARHILCRHYYLLDRRSTFLTCTRAVLELGHLESFVTNLEEVRFDLDRLVLGARSEIFVAESADSLITIK